MLHRKKTITTHSSIVARPISFFCCLERRCLSWFAFLTWNKRNSHQNHAQDRPHTELQKATIHTNKVSEPHSMFCFQRSYEFENKIKGDLNQIFFVVILTPFVWTRLFMSLVFHVVVHVFSRSQSDLCQRHFLVRGQSEFTQPCREVGSPMNGGNA